MTICSFCQCSMEQHQPVSVMREVAGARVSLRVINLCDYCFSQFDCQLSSLIDKITKEKAKNIRFRDYCDVYGI